MKYQEKKYRVGSFVSVKKKLFELGARKGSEVVSTHYYVQGVGEGVTKLVEYRDRSEIHILKESKGKFSLKETVSVKDTKTGLQWLRSKGYKAVGMVKMAQVDYEYKGGIVGLYVIDDWLHSVILDFPERQHEAVEKELGLTTAEVISVPYDNYLEQIGRLRSL